MKISIILNTNEPETVWNAFRFGNEALSKNHTVKMFLLGKGVEIENVKDDKFPLLEGSVKKFIKNNGAISACGACLKIQEQGFESQKGGRELEFRKWKSAVYSNFGAFQRLYNCRSRRPSFYGM